MGNIVRNFNEIELTEEELEVISGGQLTAGPATITTTVPSVTLGSGATVTGTPGSYSLVIGTTGALTVTAV